MIPLSSKPYISQERRHKSVQGTQKTIIITIPAQKSDIYQYCNRLPSKLEWRRIHRESSTYMFSRTVAVWPTADVIVRFEKNNAYSHPCPSPRKLTNKVLPHESTENPHGFPASALDRSLQQGRGGRTNKTKRTGTRYTAGTRIG